MPIYEYRCKNCNHLFEEFVFSSLTSDEDVVCPKCGTNKAEKMMSAFSSSASGGYSYGGSSSCGGSGGFG